MKTLAAPERKNCFADTRWSLVCAVQADGEAEPERREAALEEFCRLYWYPLYAFARRSGRSAADAEDLIQGLFAKLLAGDGLERLSPERGRVRSFLLQSLRNLMVGEWQKGQRQRRGGGAVHLSMDVVEGEERFRAEPSTGLTPEKEYERHWAATVLRRAAEQLEAEFVKSDREGIFAALSDCLGGESAKTYHELGALNSG